MRRPPTNEAIRLRVYGGFAQEIDISSSLKYDSILLRWAWKDTSSRRITSLWKKEGCRIKTTQMPPRSRDAPLVEEAMTQDRQLEEAKSNCTSA